jgi:hypothetical protein
MNDLYHHYVDPEDFTRTKEHLQAFIRYAGALGLGLHQNELDMLNKAYRYLDIMSTKNWSICDD